MKFTAADPESWAVLYRALEASRTEATAAQEARLSASFKSTRAMLDLPTFDGRSTLWGARLSTQEWREVKCTDA